MLVFAEHGLADTTWAQAALDLSLIALAAPCRDLCIAGCAAGPSSMGFAPATGSAGLSEVGVRALDEARGLATSRPSFVAPEIDRLAAALLLQAGADPMVAEEHLRAALATAHDREALALELRAAVDLRRLELANG